MRDALEAIAKTVRKVIGGIYLPLGACSEMRLLLLRYPIRRDVPHLRVGILNVLLHAKPRGLGGVFAVLHAAKLPEIRVDILLCVLASIPFAGTVLAAALELGLGFVTVAHIGPNLPNKLLGEVV